MLLVKWIDLAWARHTLWDIALNIQHQGHLGLGGYWIYVSAVMLRWHGARVVGDR